VNPPENPTADVTPAATAELLARAAVTVIDVREDEEWTTGHISGAIHIPLAALDPARIDASKPADTLRAAGLTVHNMTGGMNGWARAGLPVHAADGTVGSVR
jgi:rhodanese-related sulfurtransferase